MTVPASHRIGRQLRGVWLAVIGVARTVSPRRLVATGFAVAALISVALLVPAPTAVQVRDWAETVHPWLPLAFLGVHVVVTVFPFPRTVFTLAAGLLFGAWLGIAVAATASTLSALTALLLVRGGGWRLNRLVRHPRVESLDARMRQRGWRAVLALRLIPAVPFSVINYAAGASAVRVVPYTLATLAGLLPGTVAVVVLGDALTGEVSPLLFLVSLGIAIVGVALLVYEIRDHRRNRVGAAAAPTTEAARPGDVTCRAGLPPDQPW